VQPHIGAETTACSYDRAGVGFSDEIDRPATAKNMVDDLRKLLTAANLRPPYVLVGASSGALNARLFAYTFPDEVVGLVLVDPSHEDQTEGFRRLDPRGLSPEEWDAQVIEPSIARRRECIAAIEAGIARDSEMYTKCSFPQYPQLSPEVQEATERFQMTPKFQRAQLSEEEHVFRTTVGQLKAAARSLGPLPVLVLAQDKPSLPTSPLSEEQMTRRAARYELWISLCEASARISERGEVRVVPGAGHNISLEKPQAVISAVHDVILASRETPR
jgi:pimeloyl-ACP methyl ester carboxylesterase